LYNSLFQNGHNFCLKCAGVPRVHGHKRLDHDALAADSGINDWLVKLRRLGHSILTKMQMKIYPLLFTFSVEYLNVEYLKLN